MNCAELSSMPVVTVEQIARFRSAALKEIERLTELFRDSLADKYALSVTNEKLENRVKELEDELSKFQLSEFNPDWSMLKTSQASLLEHMCMIKERDRRITELEKIIADSKNQRPLYVIPVPADDSKALKLLGDAIDVMTKLHENLIPDEGNGGNAEIEVYHVREFVDAHADLMYEHHQLVLAAKSSGNKKGEHNG